MPTRNFAKIQDALNSLTEVQRNINELYFYKKNLKNPNHSTSACSSVCSDIDTLRTQHTDVVNALLFYGSSYGNIASSLASQNSSDYQGTPPKEFYYTAAPEHQKSEWEKFWNQLILGEFSEDVSWQGVTGNILVGIVAGFFGVDAPLDIRDAAANFSKGEWGWGLLDCLFLLPVVGAFKPVKYTDELAVVVKYGDEVIEVASTVTKNGDDILQGVYKLGDKTYGFTDEIFTGIKNVDDTAVVLKEGDRLLWVTGKNSEFILDGSTFKKINSAGEVEAIAHNVKVLPDYTYIKKSDDAYEELRKAFNKTERAAFLQDLATNDVADLKKIGLTDLEIENMKNGIVPDGYEVHHKLPLKDGGSNDHSNLILINETDHLIFSNYQVGFTNTTIYKEQGYMIVDWVIPEGKIYIP